MERDFPPPHLADLKIGSVLETSGREKRVRWFSTEALRQRCHATAVALPNDQDEDAADQAGGFMDIHPSSISKFFYNQATDLYGVTITDPKGVWGNRSKRPATEPPTLGRPRKYPKGITKAEMKALKQINAQNKASGTNAEATVPAAKRKKSKPPDADAPEMAQADDSCLPASKKRKAAGPSSTSRPRYIKRTEPVKRTALPREEVADVQINEDPGHSFTLDLNVNNVNPEDSNDESDWKPDEDHVEPDELLTLKTSVARSTRRSTKIAKALAVNDEPAALNGQSDEASGAKQTMEVQTLLSPPALREPQEHPSTPSAPCRTAVPESPPQTIRRSGRLSKSFAIYTRCFREDDILRLPSLVDVVGL